jgi:cytochrome c oxidase subunit 3
MKNINRKQFQAFPYHLVEPSPWPLLISFAILNMAIGAVMSFHGFANGGNILTLGFLLTLSGMILWFRDVIIEGTYLGDHTKEVQRGLTIGIALFIISEIFAFLSIFWAFFHSSLSPTIEIGASWPPFGIEALDPFAVPLLNTIVRGMSALLTSFMDQYSSYVLTNNELGKGENPMLNIASHYNDYLGLKHLIY